MRSSRCKTKDSDRRVARGRRRRRENPSFIAVAFVGEVWNYRVGAVEVLDAAGDALDGVAWHLHVPRDAALPELPKSLIA